MTPEMLILPGIVLAIAIAILLAPARPADYQRAFRRARRPIHHD